VPPVTIADPILNSPYREPTRHFRFDDDGITNDIVEKRRLSGYFVPIPQPRKKGPQLSFGTEWTDSRFDDEAHHCFRSKPAEQTDGQAASMKLTGDKRVEAEQREAEARVWISGLEAVKAKLGVRAVYDLSATPFFLRGSGYPEGTLFPWVVWDFSLIDAIESGIVKIPRVPVADDSMTGTLPTYRELWPRIRDDLPRKGREADAVSGEPKLPAELQGALHSLYGHYEQPFARWQSNAGHGSIMVL